MYTLELEMREALHDSFRAALVLTGSVERATRTVRDAIAMTGSDWSRDVLLVRTARSALQHQTFSDELPPVFPPELLALFLLPPTSRYCFALRVLMRFDLATCCEILKLSKDEVEEALHQSLRDLPRLRSDDPLGNKIIR
jgi:DNA-directed RNA polymerase specialized sigma24 family protein